MNNLDLPINSIDSETQMTPEQQNIAIAKASGWTDIGAAVHFGRSVTAGINPIGGTIDPLPDFTSDLNACAEMERTLGRRFLDYNATLFKVVTDTNLARGIQIPRHIFSVITATPAQRSEAFLKCLGLWQDDPAKSL